MPQVCRNSSYILRSTTLPQNARSSHTSYTLHPTGLSQEGSSSLTSYILHFGGFPEKVRFKLTSYIAHATKNFNAYKISCVSKGPCPRTPTGKTTNHPGNLHHKVGPRQNDPEFCKAGRRLNEIIGKIVYAVRLACQVPCQLGLPSLPLERRRCESSSAFMYLINEVSFSFAKPARLRGVYV